MSKEMVAIQLKELRGLHLDVEPVPSQDLTPNPAKPFSAIGDPKAMHKGFNLTLGSIEENPYSLELGSSIYEDNKKSIKGNLDSFMNKQEKLVAERIISEWFPSIDANIFLSHSHKDTDLAITLSGWLKKTFDLTSFVDSCIWGYSEELLRSIDDKYCYKETTGTYSYEKRNISTGHVYTMLSTALAKMIDSCECVMFLNTPNSISPAQSISQGATGSPWIYNEISISRLIRRRSLNDHRGDTSKIRADAVDESVLKSLKIEYPLDLQHFADLTLDNLNKWAEENDRTGAEALDYLYRLKNS